MGMFDDLTADIPGAAVKAGGAYDDLTQDIAPGDAPPGPNNFRVNWGPFGHQDFETDPNSIMGGYVLPAVDAVNYGTNSMLRGGVNGLAQIPEAIYASFWGPNSGKLGIKPEEAYQPHWGTVVNDTIGVPARPHDAGFGTDVLEATGGAFLTPGPGAGSFWPTLARDAAGAVTSVLGADAGSWIGQQFGGEQGAKAGEFLGSFGGGIAPAAVERAGGAGVRSLLAKPNGQSGAAYDVLSSLGIDPTPGLVGNRSASRMENSGANFPVVGGIVHDRQTRAFDQFQRGFYSATDMIDGGNSVTTQRARAPGYVGGQMRDAANNGLDNLTGQFERGYAGVNSAVPDTVLVGRENLDAEMARQNNIARGEDPRTLEATNDFVSTVVDPMTVGRQGPIGHNSSNASGLSPQDAVHFNDVRPGPGVPGQPYSVGIPFQRHSKGQTAAFRDAGNGTVTGGATEQIRQAMKADRYAAMERDPEMIARFPNPWDRAALVERLRVLDTEYATARATNISRSGVARPGDVLNGDRAYVGGDKPALDRVANAPLDANVYAAGSQPDNMAVLQRTAPDAYPSMAADVVRNEAQANQPNGPINVSPQVFATWWNGLSDHEKLIYANERNPGTQRSFTPQELHALGQQPTPITNTLNAFGDAGELFRQAGAQANPSGTAPTLAAMGVGAGLLTSPLRTIGGLMSGGAFSRAVSSPALARTIADRGATTAEVLLDALRRNAGYQSAIINRPDYGGPR